MPGAEIQNGDGTRVLAFNSIDECLVATLQADVDERYLRRLETDISNALWQHYHSTLIIDATPLELIDATDFGWLRRVIDTVRLMGVETIIVGLKPGVVASLVELEANIDGLETTLNMDAALRVAGQRR